MAKKDVLIVVIGLGLAIKTGLNVIRLVKNGERVKQAQIEVDQAKAENQQLKDRLAEVQSPEFIEKEAREKLGLGKPGEEVIILPQQDAGPKPQTTNPNKPNWRVWWDVYIAM